jgi:hypothetical protein
MAVERTIAKREPANKSAASIYVDDGSAGAGSRGTVPLWWTPKRRREL